MAGTKNSNFVELISPFLRRKIAEAEAIYGLDSIEVHSLTRQYIYDAREKQVRDNERRRHYESEVLVYFENRPIVGVERLYRRTILLEPTTVCAAHCRWCLRGQYPVKTMTEDEIVHATRYIGSEGLREDIDEELITGGDPLMSLPLLALTLSELERNAPNVQTVRIGSRVIFQDPRRINDSMMIYSPAIRIFALRLASTSITPSNSGLNRLTRSASFRTREFISTISTHFLKA